MTEDTYKGRCFK